MNILQRHDTNMLRSCSFFFLLFVLYIYNRIRLCAVAEERAIIIISSNMNITHKQRGKVTCEKEKERKRDADRESEKKRDVANYAR